MNFLKHYKKTFLKTFLIIVFCFSKNLQSQSTGIKGIIVDEAKTRLEMVSVAALNPKDSTFLSYTTTDEKGHFILNDIPKDTILLQLNLLGFSSYTKKLQYKGTLIDLKTIVLKEAIALLDEIIISAVIPIQIRKDTIRFNANSFKVNYDDNLEGLLGKLPGIEIEEGKVTAQGNTITKIFVDGKEFFGGDPSIVLKNLSADVIDKIEVIDKKSEEAELTGVSDGNKEIVINFTLKKSNKNSRFGKVASGIGLDNRYFGNLNYNQFNPKTQLSVIGKFNNINITGSNIQSFLQNADGVADESEDETENNFIKPQKNLSGFLKTAITGIHFGKEIKKKESLNVDYFYNLSENSGVSKTNRIFFSNTNNFNYNSENTYLNTTDNHNLNFNYNNKSSKTNSLYIKGRFYADKRASNLKRNGSFFNVGDELVTKNENQSKDKNHKKYGNLNVNYYHRLLKKGRSFNLGFNTVINNYQKNNNQNTFVERKFNTANSSERAIKTLRNQDVASSLLNFRFKYIEPIVGNHYFNTEAIAQILSGKENTNQSRETTEITTVEDAINFNYKYSENNFKTKFFHSYNNSKLNISSGLELQTLHRSFGEITQLKFRREQFYVNPFFTFQYKPKRGRKYKFSYDKQIRAPKPNQTNPFFNDLNPYSIKIGNPDLLTEKTNSFLMRVNVHDFKSSVSFNGKLQYKHTQDAIIRNVTIEDDFIRTSSYQNKGIRQRFNAQLDFGKKVSNFGIRFNFKNKFSYREENSVVNFDLNNVVSQDYLTSFIIQNTSKRTIDLKAGATYGLNNTDFSIENDLNRKYTTQKYFGMVDFDISKKFNFNTQLDYIVYDDNNFSIHQEIPIWNAAISYSLTNRNNIVKLVFIDLLNKNRDVFRRSTLNYFEETTLQSLGRYIVLSYTYKLNAKNKKRKSKSA
ncbi:MAG: outer membrane beta-barrel protein [Polaribacter sp.]